MELFAPGIGEGMARSAVVVFPTLLALAFASRRLQKPIPIGGVLVVVVVVAALAGSGSEITILAAGALLAAAGGLVGHRFSLGLPARLLLIAPGAFVAVRALGNDRPAWVGILAVVAATCSGVLVDLVEERYGESGLPMLMAAVSAAGVYVTIPETGLVAPVAGALLVLAVLAWPLVLVRLGPGGGSAVVVILAALTANGGWVRPGAVIGGLAAPALLLVLARGPVPEQFRRIGRFSDPATWLLALHLLVTFAVTRVAGLRQDVWSAGGLAAVFLAAGWWASHRVVVRPNSSA